MDKGIERGIVLLAIGCPAYGNFAFNMAVSLREHSPNIPIQLIYEEHAISHLNDWHRSFFDWLTVIEKDDSRYPDGKLFPANAKLHLYEYSAFEKNIYFDVDGLVIKDITPLFDLCESAGGYFYSQMSGVYEIKEGKNNFPGLQWANVDDIKEYYQLEAGEVLPAINSSFQYFTHSEESQVLFDQALSLLNNPIPISMHPQKWGKKGFQPDELYMDVALCKVNLVPELAGFKELIYFNTRRGDGLDTLKTKYYLLGLYGGINFTHMSIRKMYDSELQRIFRVRGYGTHWFKIDNLMRQKIS
ncbi:MAG: hypothetical protein V4687_16055 [Bacteroidota bacterium]